MWLVYKESERRARLSVLLEPVKITVVEAARQLQRYIRKLSPFVGQRDTFTGLDVSSGMSAHRASLRVATMLDAYMTQHRPLPHEFPSLPCSPRIEYSRAAGRVSSDRLNHLILFEVLIVEERKVERARVVASRKADAITARFYNTGYF